MCIQSLKGVCGHGRIIGGCGKCGPDKNAPAESKTVDAEFLLHIRQVHSNVEVYSQRFLSVTDHNFCI
jgi:hypothetical protein